MIPCKHRTIVGKHYRCALFNNRLIGKSVCDKCESEWIDGMEPTTPTPILIQIDNQLKGNAKHHRNRCCGRK